jgi:hypothetical protein
MVCGGSCEGGSGRGEEWDLYKSEGELAGLTGNSRALFFSAVWQ